MLTETVCAAVSAGGLGIALLTAYRKRFLTATRIAAYSLIPIGLVMTGIVKAVTKLAFDPVAWVGVGILALSALLFLASKAAGRRGTGSRKERKAMAAARDDAVAPAALPGSAQTPERSKSKARPKSGGEDFSDIEAILKKHGI